MRSTGELPSEQAQPQRLQFERLYIATNGVDLIDEALSFQWMVELMKEYVSLNGEDVAIWLREDGESPRLVAFIRALANGGAEAHAL